jgi:hypothetical protein
VCHNAAHMAAGRAWQQGPLYGRRSVRRGSCRPLGPSCSWVRAGAHLSTMLA